MSRIERVSYRSGFVKRLREAAHLPAITFEAADLPEDVVALVDAHLLALGGSYGDPNAGDPIQYDELRIEHDQGAMEIYTRAILLFRTDSEAVRQIHQVCCRQPDSFEAFPHADSILDAITQCPVKTDRFDIRSSYLKVDLGTVKR